MQLDYSRRAEDAHMARLVQHDLSQKKGDGGGKAFSKRLKEWLRIGTGRTSHHDGEDLAQALGQWGAS